ncbi:hypothetical protein AX17_007217 [Amanita inopinata Kibby_2008]|nr:hypothetical protein AX17_007217 [Amanita inopinata Kibby_2008]
MTIYKYVASICNSWSTVSVINKLMGEGIAAFLLSVGLVVFLTAYYLVHSFGYLYWNAAFAWYLALSSTIGSRLIINIGQSLRPIMPPPNTATTNIELDSA